MRFLIDEDLPRSAQDLFRKYGHEAVGVRDIGLRGAPDSEIAVYARRTRFCLVTGDFDFSDIRNYPPGQYSGILVIHPDPRAATARSFLALMEGLLKQQDLLSNLPGHLAIVRPEHIRFRRA